MAGIQFIAKLDLKECDAELEKRYEEYKKAKASLMAYLYNEGLKPSLEQKDKPSAATDGLS